jgi:hypothetical protein
MSLIVGGRLSDQITCVSHRVLVVRNCDFVTVTPNCSWLSCVFQLIGRLVDHSGIQSVRLGVGKWYPRHGILGRAKMRKNRVLLCWFPLQDIVRQL